MGIKYRNVVNVIWERTPKVEGEVVGIETIDVGDRTVQAIIVEAPEGRFRIFDSATLHEAITEAAIGDRIKIEHLGMKELSGGRSLRLFNVQIEDARQGRLPMGTPGAEGV